MADSKSTYSAETLALLATLGARPIAYHVTFARVWGVKAAILLGQLIYWHGKQADPDGWILKTAGEMEEETALSEREQETARGSLLKAGAIEYSRRGLPAMPHYRLIFAEIARGVLDYQDRTKRPNKETAEQDSAKGANQLGQNVLTSEDGIEGVLIGQNVLTDTEITTEITSKITAEITEESGASAPPAPAPDSPANPSSPSSVTITETRSGSRILTLQAPESDNAGGSGSSKRTKRGGKFSPANFTEHADTRVQLYLTHIKPEITPTNAERILARVNPDYLEQWEEAILAHATGNGRGSSYKPDDFAILFDLYDKRERAKKAEAAYAEMQARKQAQKQSSASATSKPAAVSPLVARMAGRIAQR